MAITTTSPTDTPPAPQWLRDLITARTQYEELLGWPVTVDVRSRRLVLAAGQVFDTVTMSEQLGESVLAELRITMLAGPVIADSGGPCGPWWSFLTDLATTSRPEFYHPELRVHTVHLTPHGAHVVIPRLGDNEGSSRWVQPPQPHQQLPPWSALIGTTRRVINDRLGTVGSL